MTAGRTYLHIYMLLFPLALESFVPMENFAYNNTPCISHNPHNGHSEGDFW